MARGVRHTIQGREEGNTDNHALMWLQSQLRAPTHALTQCYQFNLTQPLHVPRPQVELTVPQKRLYRAVLDRNMAAITNPRASLTNAFMQLRKVRHNPTPRLLSLLAPPPMPRPALPTPKGVCIPPTSFLPSPQTRGLPSPTRLCNCAR
jgi:hypothetical protein